MAIDLISLNDDSENLIIDLSNIADYSQNSSGIVANLATTQVLTPIYQISETPKIMALGDSITAGEYPTEPTPGSYRIQLQENFTNDNLDVDFNGSQVNQNTILDDPEHEGHSGFTINQLTELLEEGLLTDYQPDIVLLMAGVNDIFHSDDADTVIDDLDQIIDRLEDELPDVPILVSSLVPTDPEIRGERRANTIAEVNSRLPELIEQQGEQVTYVNAGGLLDTSDLVADGIHPNAAGYEEIGNAWYDALVEVEEDDLTGIEHLQGTEFGDRLTGNQESNILFGNGGSDILNGGDGRDLFVYESIDSELDTIQDFSREDRFVISTTALDNTLDFNTNLTEIYSPTGVYISTVTDASSLGSDPGFFYETETGILSFDPDGIGSASPVEIAVLSNIPNLTSEQFLIIDE